MGFNAAVKILIKLKKKYWPSSIFYIYTNGLGLVPLYWVTNAGGRSNNDYVLTGFFMGEETIKYENNI